MISAARRPYKPWRNSPLTAQLIGGQLLAVLLLIGVIVFGLRGIYLNRSYEVFVDEINYLHLSRSVADELRIATVEGTFYLHPPAFYFLEGAFLKIFRPTGNDVAQLYAVRYINVILACISAMLLFLLGRRIGGPAAGIIAATIFAIDPFVTRINSRNFLETSGMFWVLVGYSIVLLGRCRVAWHWRIIGAGCAFGLALLTKELNLFLTLVPLGIVFLLNWTIPRRVALLTALLACFIYALYPLIIALSGDWDNFLWQKRLGILRFTGVRGSTGFSTERHPSSGSKPSFIGALLRNLDQFATTYLLIGAGIVAIIALLWFRDPIGRFVAAAGIGAYMQQAFSVAFGTNEDHLFYPLIVLAILAIAIACPTVMRSARLAGRLRRLVVTAWVVVCALFLGWSLFIWMQHHATEDNGYEHLLTYIEHNIPRGQRVAATTITSKELLRSQYQVGRWGTVDAVRANDAEYVVISSRLMETGFDIGTPDLYNWLRSNAELLFVFNGPSNGVLSLYRIPTEFRGGGDNGAGPPGTGQSGGAPTESPPATGTPVTRPAATAKAQSTSAAGVVSSPTPVVTPSPTAAAAPLAASTPVPPDSAELRRRIAAAETGLRTGRVVATISYPNNVEVTVIIDFDFGDRQNARRMQLTSVYRGAMGQSTSAVILVGDRMWEQQSDGRWVEVASQDGFWEQLQLYLPRIADAPDVTTSRPGDPAALRSYDARREADIELTFDTATGRPSGLRQYAHSIGVAMTITYQNWNGPVTILPPTVAP